MSEARENLTTKKETAPPYEMDTEQTINFLLEKGIKILTPSERKNHKPCIYVLPEGNRRKLGNLPLRASLARISDPIYASTSTIEYSTILNYGSQIDYYAIDKDGNPVHLSSGSPRRVETPYTALNSNLFHAFDELFPPKKAE